MNAATIRYGQMTVAVELVTVAVANRWLSQNLENRRLREFTVDQYSRDMLAGNWERKPLAICFDEEGRLGNGQHTLSAIVRSNRAQELLIARNVPRKAIAVMDRGLARTLNDVAKFLGADIESRKASVARMLKWGPRDIGRKSFDELLEAYQEHADVIDMVCSAAPRVVGMNAPILAVCAKAAYSKEHEKIKRFLHVLQTGMADGEHESAAIRLRDFSRSLRGASSQELREEAYNKAQSALQHFLSGRPMTKLYGTPSDLFPVMKKAPSRMELAA